MLLVLAALPAAGLAVCVNPVSCENEKPGASPGSWQVQGSGDASIQGYATTMSVDRGGTIRFKVKTTASNYHIDIYRLGYYQGNGARLQASNVRPTASLPQNQPACITTAATGLIDCGNWGVSASWTVPAASVSGVYLARLVRDDNGGASQIPFVVRDDAGSSDMLVRTSDATWQAYNKYGGNSLYSCTACPPGNPQTYQGAFSVSYNRPFDGTIPQDGGRSYLFYAEYQMIRFIERNGYDASYTSQADVDANAGLLRNHDVILSSGHDEYWSGRERANVEAARDAGVSLAFFSGNEVFWKTRWQPSSADGTSTQYRTLTSYKDTHFTGPTDPVEWTGTWRDPRFSPGDGGRPENSLTGQLFIVNSGSADLKVPAEYKNLRLWRNTAVASLGAGQTRTLAPGGQTLGYEWDVDVDNGFRPRGSFKLSSTTVSGIESFTDYGSSVELGTTQTHNLTMYPGGGDALVFGAGTVQWAWGLDTTNAWASNGPPSGASVDPVMQQATVNLFADMGAQPSSLMSGLSPASRSTDTTEPSSTISSPSPGAAIADGTRFTISGTATDTGGAVAGVEVSTDDGATWHPATGTTSWSYSWIVHGAPSTTIRARAVDDSGNLESSTPSVSVGVGCPCTLFGPNVTPSILDQQDPSSVELGVRFKADLDGAVTGVRFYKATANTGSHVGNLWSANGTLLASGTFSGESASGWQQLTFSTPVDITAGTTYVASYFAPRGHYSTSSAYFYMPSPTGGNTADTSPLHALSANGGGANGVYSYGSGSTFPNSTYNGENYAVDVVFTPKLPPGPVSNVSATAGTGSATVNFTAPATGGPPTRYVVTPFIGSTAQPTTTVTGSPPATSVKVSNLDAGTAYTFRVQAGNGSGISALSAPSNAVTPTPPTVPGAPTALIPSAGNQQATLRWTAPNDGGATITRYTVTPYLNGVAQATTAVTGSPAPETAVVTGLTNGSSYTFTVTASNSVGAGPASAVSSAVTPNAAPRFIQRVSGRSTSGPTLQLTPTSNLAAGNRMVVMAGVWSAGAATISGVTDSRRQHLHEGHEPEGVGEHRAERLERADHRRRRHAADDHDHRHGRRRHRRRRARVRRPVDRVGGRGDRPAQDRHGQLDRHRLRHLRSDAGAHGRQRPGHGLLCRLRLRAHADRRSHLHRARQRVADLGHGVRRRGRAAAARRHARGARHDRRQHAVADGDGRVQERRAGAAGALDLAGEPGVLGDRGRRVAGGQDDLDRERRWRVDGLDRVGECELVERVAGERDERGDGDGDAVGQRACRRDVHDGRHGDRGRRGGLAEDDPRDVHGRSARACGAGGHPRDAVVLGDRGWRVAGGQDVRGVEHRRRVDGLDGVGERELDERVAGERHERGHRDGDAVGDGVERRHVYG